MTSNIHLDEYLDFQKYWQVLKRRWMPALATFAGIVGVATVGSLLSPNIYKAEAELLIKSDDASRLAGLEDSLGKVEGLTLDSNPVTTQARIIQSRPIVKQLIKDLNLRDDEGKLLKYESVEGNLRVKPIVGTDVLQIAYTNKDPEVATMAVNKLVELYIDSDTLNNSSFQLFSQKIYYRAVTKSRSQLKTGRGKVTGI